MAVPPGFARIGLNLKHELDPDPWVTTFGVDIGAFSGAPDAQEIGQAAQEAYWSAWRADTSNQVRLLGADVVVGQDGDNLSEFVAGYAGSSGTTVGGTASDKLPQNCALLVRKNTSRGGRRGKGRMFLPGVLNEGGVDGVGQISNVDLTAWQSNVSSFFDNLETAGLPMVLLHETGAVLAPDPVTSLVCDPVISTQRRRLR